MLIDKVCEKKKVNKYLKRVVSSSSIFELRARAMACVERQNSC